MDIRHYSEEEVLQISTVKLVRTGELAIRILK